MRVRITFSKMGAMQYVGHLDLHRSWERTFRRACLPLQYSQGYHPQPRLNLACALPVGFTSQCELLDAWLEREFPLEDVREAVRAALVPGIEIIDMSTVDDHVPALQTQVMAAVYRITFSEDFPDLEERVRRILAAANLPRMRRDKAYDLRLLIEDMNVLQQDENLTHSLRVKLAAREAATGRPEELLDEMGIKFENTHVHREQLILTTA